MKANVQMEMLAGQKAKIDSKEFDLEAWKSTTATVISKIFGADDPRVNTIEKLKIDYGSWALRDASSNYDPLGTCRKIANDLMDLSIQELQMADEEPDSLSLLADHMTGSQMKEIRAILNVKDRAEMKSQLTKKLVSYKAPLIAEILSTILVDTNN